MQQRFLPSKEATPFATEFVASFIDRCGLTKVTLRTDGEHAMTSLADKVKDRREHGALLQQAPKHSSASMGVVERAHWHLEIQSQTRTMKSQIAGAYQTATISHTHPIFPWIVRRSSWLLTRCLVKATGMTAYAAVYGEEYRKEIVPFGETIMVKIPAPDHRGIRPGVRAHKGDTTRARVMWLGRSEITDEHLAGTAEGLVRSRTIRRLHKGSKADRTKLESIQCLPWDTGRGGTVKRGRPLTSQPVAFAPAHFVEHVIVTESSPTDESAEHPLKALSASFDPYGRGGAESSSAPVVVPAGPSPT